ncbi:hypothetical protein DYBT9275_02768 [Dyadobacter sp. CECT 9275]|uniref:Uncharacterized protein n=2 Tax=Dyadobacter helix TaxID=2822344 RepID=A0A916JDN2_9BACT|nr:hypothetical protein DYBT9275_02768 [Dyadobacter sp. CECT 9275]
MPQILANLEDSMTDSRVQQRHNLMPKHEILRLVKEQETATFESVRPNDRKCEEFSVAWLEESDTEATVHTSVDAIHRAPCSISGEQLQSNKKTYKVDKSVKYTVEIKDEDCGNMFDTESKVALALLQGQKKLVAALAKTLPGYIYAYAGVNQADGIDFDGNIGENDSTDPFVTIAPADLIAEKTIPYLTMLAEFNTLQNPILVDGGMFFLDRWKAQAQAGTNAGDVGNENFWALANYNQDIWNMNKAGYLNWAFVIDRGNLALPIVSFFPRLGGDNEVVADKYIYSIPLAGITLGGQPVYIDVTYTKSESQIGSTGRCELVHVFNMELKFNLWQAPRYTTDPVTGIIALKKGLAA